MKEIIPQIDRCVEISMRVMVVNKEGNFVPKILTFTELSQVSIDGVNDHIMCHMDDILNNRSFVLENGSTIQFDRAKVEVESLDD